MYNAYWTQTVFNTLIDTGYYFTISVLNCLVK